MMKNCADLSGSMRRFSLKHSFIFLNWNWLPPSLIICCLITFSLCLYYISTEKKIELWSNSQNVGEAKTYVCCFGSFHKLRSHFLTYIDHICTLVCTFTISPHSSLITLCWLIPTPKCKRNLWKLPISQFRTFFLPDRLHFVIFPFFGRHNESKLGKTVQWQFINPCNQIFGANPQIHLFREERLWSKSENSW